MIQILRYDPKEDDAFILNALNKDEPARNKLNLTGHKSKFEVDTWGICLVARNGPDHCGFIYGEMQCKKGMFYISELYVEDSYRGNSIGPELLSRTEKIAKKEFPILGGIYLFSIGFGMLENFYKKAGFEKSGVYKNFIYKDGKYHPQTLWIKK